MDIYKNKSSGKLFIHVKDVDHDNALLITPQGALKSLKLNLFEYQESMDEAHCLQKELITQLQVEQYRKSFRLE
jgi:cellobiose-specific phosphotransferase system component IIA